MVGLSFVCVAVSSVSSNTAVHPSHQSWVRLALSHSDLFFFSLSITYLSGKFVYCIVSYHTKVCCAQCLYYGDRLSAIDLSIFRNCVFCSSRISQHLLLFNKFSPECSTFVICICEQVLFIKPFVIAEF